MQLEITDVSLKGTRKQVNDVFKVQIIYLGEEIRAVEVKSGVSEPMLMVLKRVDENNEVRSNVVTI